MLSAAGRKSRGPGISSLNAGRIPSLGMNSGAGTGFKAASVAYGGLPATNNTKPVLGGGAGGINSGNVFNIPKYGSGLGGGIGGGGGLGGGIGAGYGSGSLGGGIGSGSGSGVYNNPGSGLGSGSGLNLNRNSQYNQNEEGRDSAVGRYNF